MRNNRLRKAFAYATVRLEANLKDRNQDDPRMQLRELLDAHRVQQKHLLQFFDDNGYPCAQPYLSKMVTGSRKLQPRYRVAIRLALSFFGATDDQIDSVPELQP